MPPKKPQLTNKSHCSGARARKDQHAFEMAKHRAAKAAALREEVGDIEEDVVPYEHKGGQAGESIRLKRLKPSPASDDVGNSKTTTCFADRNTSVACAAGTGNTEPAISSPAPSASKKQAPGHNKRNWQIMNGAAADRCIPEFASLQSLLAAEKWRRYHSRHSGQCDTICV